MRGSVKNSSDFVNSVDAQNKKGTKHETKTKEPLKSFSHVKRHLSKIKYK